MISRLVEEPWIFVADVEGKRLGSADCAPNGDRICLGDLKVGEAFRRQGVGSALLNKVIKAATVEGYREIYGSLTPEDIAETPGLEAWYKKRGFVLSAPDGDCVPDAKWKITRALRSNSGTLVHPRLAPRHSRPA